MQYLNQHGVEVNIPDHIWERVKHDRPHEAVHYSRADLGHDTPGPKDSVLYLLFENGIGDVIHSLPAIRAKIESGVHVSVGCNPDQAPIYRRLGCEIIEEIEPEIGTISKYSNQFGRIHSLRHWCRTHDEVTGGDVTVNRFQQFSDYIQSPLPISFDWKRYLLANPKSKSPVCDIILGLDSTSPQRGYPHHQQLFDELTARHFIVRAMGLPGKGAEYAETLTMDGLMSAVDGARTVVAVDAGILAIALALGKPVVALMGPTQESIIVQQFSKYRPMHDVSVLRSTASDPRCARPCNFSDKRGFGVGGKCNTQADCMREIGITSIISTLEELWKNNSKSKPLSKVKARRTLVQQVREELAQGTPPIAVSVKASTKRGSARSRTLSPSLPATT